MTAPENGSSASPPAPKQRENVHLCENQLPRRQQDASTSRHVDHDRKADARTARNTAVNWAASSMPEENRTTARSPAPQTTRAAPLQPEWPRSRSERSRALPASSLPRPHSASPGASHVASRTPAANRSATAAQPRHTATWNQGLCDDPCRLIRRPAPPAAGSVRTSTRRKPPFASSLTSNITIARSLCLKQNQARRARPLNKGIRAPLTVDPVGMAEQQCQVRHIRSETRLRVGSSVTIHPNPTPDGLKSPPITNHTRVAASENCLRAWMFCNSVGL